MRKLYIKARLKDLYLYLRFGRITSKVEERLEGVVSQECFYGRNGKVIGFWAYGNYDPNLPYKG